jgi:colicin import membrane protein
MKGPSIQKTTALSATLHLTFFILAAVILKQSNSIIIPSPYVVSLVSPAGPSKERATDSAAASVRTEAKVAEPAGHRDETGTRALEPIKHQDSSAKDAKADQKQIEDRLSELKAKKKVKDIVGLRSKMLSIQGSESKALQAHTAQNTGGPSSQGTLFDSYYAKITQQIWQEWVYPDTGDKNLEAVIAVKIAKDGSVTIRGIEKGSGNTLFDRSALRAISKASPVSPPPYEMELGMRFYP